MKHTAEQILGSYDVIIGYNENVQAVQNILINSGRLVNSILTNVIAQIVWARVCKNNVSNRVVVSETDLDYAIDILKIRLNEIV